MKTPKPLFESIDLKRHAIVNASAGTGKTFTIQNLYTRLIAEQGFDPSQILVLTFTEKATSELRQKIRKQLLDSQAAVVGDSQQRLNAALLSFDNAQIFTIHGFCQRALAQFAFENGEPFRLNTGDDTELYEATLRDLLRNVWPQEFGDALPGLLSYAGFPGSGRTNWEGRVIKLARRLRKRPTPADRLIPEPPTVDAILDAQRNIKAIFARISKLSASRKGEEAPALRQFRALRQSQTLNATHAKSGEPFLIDALRIADQTGADLLEAAQLLQRGTRKIQNFAAVKKGKDSELAACQELSELAKLFQELHATANSLTEAFTTLAAWRLHDSVERHKREEGLLSFDDMLTRLRDALDESLSPDTAPLLLQGLRERYRAAIVDEAQDTDRVQWDILQRVFVSDPNAPQRLFAVGDPKQAIYAFRGADVEAYVRACDAMQSSSEKYTLPENWRATGVLTQVLNALFGTGYFRAESRFAYSPVQPVEDSRRKVRVKSDPAYDGCPLVLYALNKGRDGKDEPSVAAGEVRDRVAHFVSEEIERLLNPDSPRIILDVRGVVRSLQPGDICILVRTKNEAPPIEQALSEKGIPHSHYKKDGLFDSDEALELSCLLTAIAKPADNSAQKRALLTSFFRAQPEQLAATPEIPAEHRVRLLFSGWRQKAEKRQWAQLFRSILNDTAVFAAPPCTHRQSAERRQMNFQHLVEDLENTARRQHLDFLGIVDHLQRSRFQSTALEKDAGLQRIESERSKVQIMTMHVSKGLEFPVVFIAGGMGNDRDEDVLTYHLDNGTVVHDLQPSDDAETRWDREREEEAKRLYYVALTRAQVKLYVPVLSENGKTPTGKAITTKRAFVRVLTPRLLALLSPRVLGVASVAWSERPNTTVTSERREAPAEQAFTLQDAARIEKVLSGQFPSDYGLRRRVHRSYSALKHAQRAFGDQRGARASDEATPHLRRTEALSFPAGTEAGSLLHALLENVDFPTVLSLPSAAELAKRDDFKNLLIEHDHERIACDNEAYLIAAAGIVWRALRTPLDASFALGGLKKSDRIQELEFTFPLPTGQREAVSTEMLKKLGLRLDRGTPDVRGYLNGFMDLVYRRSVNGVAKYFVLDWKSDALDAYDATSLRAHMDAMDYTLQYKVYAQALARWLTQCGLDPTKSFGGLQYIFLRGVGADINDPQAGILTIDVPADLRDWELELYARLNDRPRRDWESGA